MAIGIAQTSPKHSCALPGFDPSTHICVQCARDKRDRVEAQQRASKQLKLFAITIYPERNPGLGFGERSPSLGFGPPPEDVIILDVDEASASDNALSAMGYADSKERTRVEINLIEGPFEAGQILAHKIRKS